MFHTTMRIQRRIIGRIAANNACDYYESIVIKHKVERRYLAGIAIICVNVPNNNYRSVDKYSLHGAYYLLRLSIIRFSQIARSRLEMLFSRRARRTRFCLEMAFEPIFKLQALEY